MNQYRLCKRAGRTLTQLDPPLTQVYLTPFFSDPKLTIIFNLSHTANGRFVEMAGSDVSSRIR